MKKIKSTKKVKKLPGKIIMQTIRSIEPKKVSMVEATDSSSNYDSPPLNVRAFRPIVSRKPTMSEVNKMVLAAYEVLDKNGITFENVQEDNQFFDSISLFLEESFDWPEHTSFL